MLTNLTLENFKAFQKLDDLKIKPITILCGTNSCGKSSILQSILLLKQTLESKKSSQVLLLNGQLVKLGYFQDILFRKDSNNEMSFSIKLKLNKEIQMSRFFSSLVISRIKYSLQKDYFLQLKLALKASEENGESDVEYLKPLIVKSISLMIFEKTPLKDDIIIEISAKNITNDEYEAFFIENGRKTTFKGFVKIGFSNLFPNAFAINLEEYIAYSNLTNLFLQFGELTNIAFKHYSYIGPLRGEPERRYVYEDEIGEIGNKGENAAYLYLTEQNKRIENHYFFNPSIDNFEKSPNQTLHSALQKWFELMKIPNFEAEITNKIIYLNMEASAYDETRVGIADVGFGVSQIFPIILEGLRMDKGSTLMLEQPEIHLHPNLQMQMADYFISLALSGKQVLVETHSDHVINRLVRRIVEDENHNLQDLIGIYFIKPSENGSVYEEVKIDETKGIVNWPPDFFDQTANEQMKIMQAGLKKRKNQRVAANGKNS